MPRGTSMAAYRAGAPRRPSHRKQIFMAILDAGPMGKTFDELMVELSLNHSSSTSRITELRKMGAVEDSGKTRLTRNNAAATVWVVSAKAAAKIAALKGTI